MLFVCCDESIPRESQLVLALKTLCGFDVREIAERLFTTDANVYKRLARARSRLRQLPLKPEVASEQLTARLSAVQAILYLMFTEGYLSSHAEGAIRRQLCDEAKRLTGILAAHPAGAAPETFALLALMHLHAARMPARQDGSGGLLLLEEQDRLLWDQHEISLGLASLRSRQGFGSRATTPRRASRRSTALRLRSLRRAGIESSNVMRCSSTSHRRRFTRSIARWPLPSSLAPPRDLPSSSGWSLRRGSSARTYGVRRSPTCMLAVGTPSSRSATVTPRSVLRPLQP